MPNYLVTWVIDIDDVDNAQEAAKKALVMMRDPESIATVFNVVDKDHTTTVDLWEGEDNAP